MRNFLVCIFLLGVVVSQAAQRRDPWAAKPEVYIKKATFSETLIATREAFSGDLSKGQMDKYLLELTNRISLDFPLANTTLFSYSDFDLRTFLLKSDFGSDRYRQLTGGAVLERLEKSWLISDGQKEFFAKAKLIDSEQDELRLNAIEKLASRLHKMAMAKTGRIAYVRRKDYGMRGTNATMYAWFTDVGSAICVYDPAEPEKGETVIFETKEGFIFDLNPSFDGQKLLMSYKENKGQSFHIWEINIDGSGLRQITDGPFHDVTPVYYPDGRIIFSSTRSEAYSMCQSYLAFNLYVCDGEGEDIRRFDFSTLCSVSPSLMDDGSIICSRWEYMDKTLFTWQGLWTINPNGSQLKLFYGNTLMVPQSLYGPKQIPETNLVIYVMAGHHVIPMHDLAIVDRSKGIESPEASRKVTNKYPRHVFEKAKDWKVTKHGGDSSRRDAYSEPWPFCKELSVVSFGGNGSGRACAVLLDHGGITYPLFADEKGGCFSVVSLGKRKTGHVVPGNCPQEAGTGRFYVQDVYQGLLKQGVKRGQVKGLRVWRQVPKKYNTEGGRIYDHYPLVGVGTYYVKELYGTVPVDDNGSAYFDAPSNVELYFQAIDERGREIQRMGSVTQITTGENVSCVGCHEDRLSAPVVPFSSMKRLSRPADKIKPNSWSSKRVDYVKLVQPIWDKHCVKCHNPTEPKGGVDMSGDKTRFFNMSYDSLLLYNTRDHNRVFDYNKYVQGYFLWGGPGGVFPAMKTGSMVSNLLDILDKGHHDVKLSDDEYRRVCVWIDANIPYYSTWEMSRPYSAGGRDLLTVPGENGRPTRPGWAKVIEEALRSVRMEPGMLNFTHPKLSRYLIDNLAKSAGGTMDDEKALFKSKSDPDYQDFIKAMNKAKESIIAYPRMDMDGAKAIPQRRYFDRVFGVN